MRSLAQSDKHMSVQYQQWLNISAIIRLNFCVERVGSLISLFCSSCPWSGFFPPPSGCRNLAARSKSLRYWNLGVFSRDVPVTFILVPPAVEGWDHASQANAPTICANVSSRPGEWSNSPTWLKRSSKDFARIFGGVLKARRPFRTFRENPRMNPAFPCNFFDFSGGVHSQQDGPNISNSACLIFYSSLSSQHYRVVVVSYHEIYV